MASTERGSDAGARTPETVLYDDEGRAWPGTPETILYGDTGPLTDSTWPGIRDGEVGITQYSPVSEAATKSRIYVDPRECTSEEWREVRQHEFEKLCKHGAIETVRPTKEQLEGAVIIPVREVEEIKDYGRRKKARFATRGDLERRWRQTRGLEDVDASSPTATPEEDRAVQHLAACRNWPMVGFDIPEAYTQQDPKLWERRLKERGGQSVLSTS